MRIITPYFSVWESNEHSVTSVKGTHGHAGTHKYTQISMYCHYYILAVCTVHNFGRSSSIGYILTKIRWPRSAKQNTNPKTKQQIINTLTNPKTH